MNPNNNPDVEIDWENARAANQENWDERAVLHAGGGYNLEPLRTDPAHVSPVVAYDLPYLLPHLPAVHSTSGTADLSGLDLCHLQCHIGTDTVSFARLGARVTGLDFSPEALKAARALADELGHDVRWVEGDVLEAATIVENQFDVVYTSIGTICWLNDLAAWARQIAALLRSGGVFYIRDGHPSLYIFDEMVHPPAPRYRYFPNGLAQSWDDDTTYAGDGKLTSTRTYEWPHPISEVVNALLAAGLRLEAMHEGDTLPWAFSNEMVQVGQEGWMWPEPLRDVIPCTFTLVARKV